MTPYEAGYNAALSGLKLSANPFTEGTDSYEEWRNGWWAYWNERRELE